jgi:transcription elongation factor Elf1
MSNCPKCGNSFKAVKISDITIGTGNQGKWKGVSYDCPSCGASLGVELDPIAVKNDIVSEVVKKLKR